MKRIRFIRDDIQDFLLSFDDEVVSKIMNSLEILDELGEQVRPPRSKKIVRNVYELRILSDLSVRIFYSFHKESIWIIHAFIKKSRKLPLKELKTAIHRLHYLQ